VQWQADQEGTFALAPTVKFAEDNGWECEHPREVSAAELSGWAIADKPVFPVVFGLNNASSRELPRHIDGAALLARCETGWIRVDPGTSDATPAYGYVLIQRDGRRMAVYHHWGEG